MKSPEIYQLTATKYVPNSDLPVLVYRNCLPQPHDAESTRKAIEANNWYQGGVFKHYPAHHWHITMECYAVFRGNSKLLLGRGPLDDQATGTRVEISAGDAIVLPAGVSHCCLESSKDYEYAGLYPNGSPHWENNFGKIPLSELEEKVEAVRQASIPTHDPVYGKDGPLCQIWSGIRSN